MRKQEIPDKASAPKRVKVLLCEDVKDLGWLGDVIEVSTGYARNCLLPQGLAIVPTQANLRSLAKEAARRAENRKLERERLEEVAAAVNGAEAVVASKANEQGVLFGSISAAQVGENLRAQGFKVADEMVHLTEHIKQVGTHEVTLKFDKDLTAAVNVVVVAESAEREAVPSAGEITPEASKAQEENKPNDQQSE